MALKKCVQCGWDVSSEAANCPGCGAPVSAPAIRINWEPCPRCASGRVRHLARGRWFLVGVGLIIFGAALLVIPPLGVVVILGGVFLITRVNNRACLDCLYAWRYPSKSAQKLRATRSLEGHKPRPMGSGLLVVGGVLFVLFVLLMGIGLIAERQGKAKLARADELWIEGKQAEAVSIYVGEMLYVDDANKPEVYKRIITQLYDSGDTDGATGHSLKAIDGNINVEFARDDLSQFFYDLRPDVEYRAESLDVETIGVSPELSDGAGSGYFKLEQAPLVEGMTYAEVSGVIGWEGTARGSLAGPDDSQTTVYKWDDEEGSLVATFRDDALKKWDYDKRKIQVVDENQQAEALVQAKLNTYSTTLDAAGVTIVRNINVKLNGNLWTVTLKVDDVWHYKPYQVRLQDTQTFWQVWAQIASPNEPDSARISIEDLNGNEVGGSRILAGSMIWVQE